MRHWQPVCVVHPLNREAVVPQAVGQLVGARQEMQKGLALFEVQGAHLLPEPLDDLRGVRVALVRDVLLELLD